MSIEDSKVTRVHCGLEPPRVQVMVVCVTARFCSAAVSFDKRAKRLRACPPMVENCPPAKILPSACSAIAETILSAFGSNESGAPVVASSRAMRMRVCPSIEMKPPPAKILPSACTASVETELFGFGLKESGAPVESSRARFLRVCPPMVLNPPPTRILPSACTTSGSTRPFGLGSNESAVPVVASSRAMKLRVCPPMLCAPWKSPTAKILPSACTAIERTRSLAFGLKESAAPVVASSRAM